MIVLFVALGCGEDRSTPPPAPRVIAPAEPLPEERPIAAPEPPAPEAPEARAPAIDPAVAADQRRRRRDARRLVHAGDPGAALPIFDALVAELPARVDLRCEAGYVAMLADQPERAAHHVEIGLALLGPLDQVPERHHRMLGQCLYNAGRNDEQEGRTGRARSRYEESLRVRPNAVVRARLDALGPASEEDERPIHRAASLDELGRAWVAQIAETYDDPGEVRVVERRPGAEGAPEIAWVTVSTPDPYATVIDEVIAIREGDAYWTELVVQNTSGGYWYNESEHEGMEVEPFDVVTILGERYLRTRYHDRRGGGSEMEIEEPSPAEGAEPETCYERSWTDVEERGETYCALSPDVSASSRCRRLRTEVRITPSREVDCGEGAPIPAWAQAQAPAPRRWRIEMRVTGSEATLTLTDGELDASMREWVGRPLGANELRAAMEPLTPFLGSW